MHHKFLLWKVGDADFMVGLRAENLFREGPIVEGRDSQGVVPTDSINTNWECGMGANSGPRPRTTESKNWGWSGSGTLCFRRLSG